MKFVVTPLALAIALALGWFVYRHSQVAAQPEEKTDQPVQAIAVEVTRVQKRAIEDRIELVGSIEAIRQVDIRSRVEAYITKLPLDVGDKVEKGDVIVELDDSTMQELVSSAAAALKVAEAQLKAQRADEVLAQKQVKRIAELRESGVATQQQLDEMESQLAVAEAKVELELARVAQAAAERHRNQILLDETSIRAAGDGYVAERFVDVGDLAQSDTPLLKIVDIATVKTAVYVVERDYEKVRIDQLATIRVDAFPNRSFTGIVVRKAPILDRETRTALVQIEIRNLDTLLKPGMHARVKIVFQRRLDAAVIPVASLIETHDRSAVFVVQGNPPISNLQEVKVGIRDGELIEILSGIDSNDRIVTLGSRMLKHGQQVKPIEVSLPKELPQTSDSAAED